MKGKSALGLRVTSEAEESGGKRGKRREASFVASYNTEADNARTRSRM